MCAERVGQGTYCSCSRGLFHQSHPECCAANHILEERTGPAAGTADAWDTSRPHDVETAIGTILHLPSRRLCYLHPRTYVALSVQGAIIYYRASLTSDAFKACNLGPPLHVECLSRCSSCDQYLHYHMPDPRHCFAGKVSTVTERDREGRHTRLVGPRRHRSPSC